MMDYVSYFFGGAFLTNAIPHLVAGLMGEPFQSPFAKPPGRGLSSSIVNVLWAMTNVLFSYLLLVKVGKFDFQNWFHVGAAGAGALAISLQLASHFGEFHGGNLRKAQANSHSDD